MIAVISLVYGVATIRLSGVAVLISSAVRATGNQACPGWAAATSLIGAMQPADLAASVLQGLPEMGPAGGVEQGEGEVGLEDPVLPLRAVDGAWGRAASRPGG